MRADVVCSILKESKTFQMDLFPAGHPLLRALTERDYNDPTPVQAAVIPLAAEAVAEFVSGRQRSDLDRNRMLLFALVRAIEVLGEAASKVSMETRSRLPEMPWPAIVGMRNRLIHGYFDVDPEIVWKTVTLEVPPLRDLLREVLADPTA